MTKDIQNQIVDLVGSEAKGLDLVNGKLDEQIKKLKTIQQKQDETFIRSLENSYNKSHKRTSTKLNSYKDGNWYADIFNDDGLITIDEDSADIQEQIANIVNEAWKNKYGNAYMQHQNFDPVSLLLEVNGVETTGFADVWNAFELNDNLSLSQQKEAFETAIDAIAKNLEDYKNSDRFPKPEVIFDAG